MREPFSSRFFLRASLRKMLPGVIKSADNGEREEKEM